MIPYKSALTLVALGIGTLGCGAAGAEVTVLHYVSADDFALQESGQLIAIHEYVEITLDPAGPDWIEVGYQHWSHNAVEFLDFVGFEFDYILQDLPDLTVADLGRLDLVNLRRVAMTGTVEIGPDTLTWEVVELMPTPAQGPYDLLHGSVRPSPFQMEGERITVGRRGGSETELGDSLVIVAGHEEHRYRLADPAAVSLTAFLPTITERSIIQTRNCMAPVAEAYLAGEAYAFSAAAIAELEALAEGEPALALLQQRGYGVALEHFLDDALLAKRALGKWLTAEVESFGLEQAISSFSADDALSDAQRAWTERVRVADRIMTGLHILPGDERFPADPIAGEQFAELVEVSIEAYHADPWSQTGPFTNAIAGRGWVGMVLLLLSFECP